MGTRHTTETMTLRRMPGLRGPSTRGRSSLQGHTDKKAIKMGLYALSALCSSVQATDGGSFIRDATFRLAVQQSGIVRVRVSRQAERRRRVLGCVCQYTLNDILPSLLFLYATRSSTLPMTLSHCRGAEGAEAISAKQRIYSRIAAFISDYPSPRTLKCHRIVDPGRVHFNSFALGTQIIFFVIKDRPGATK